MIMIKIPAEVKQIAEIFKKNNKTLYTVGGFNRDSYLGIQSLLRDDIDLCSNVKPKELFKMFEGTGFEIKNINESLGVMAIVGKKRYEHATFRKEYYETESHTPTKVEFINSLEEDAKRRDFRINAIYYNVSENSFIDPLGGIDDLRERKITTVKPPKMVFNDDPERILRLVRFASALGLSIPEEEMFYAKQNAYKIKFISKFRLRAEFERLLTADQMYPELTYTRDAHFRAMVLLGELDAWKDILPVMEDMKNTQVVDKKGEKIYDHILNCLKNASPKIRLAILLHDAGKVKTLELNKRMFGAKEFVETIVNKNLGIDGLGYAKHVVSKVTKTIIGYDFNSWCLASKKAD
ncbi:MAG: CCA tRNA nucleotidyltransferase, partial [Clostridia bacterium]|nr:CCA tRNA nucleotidyltransferase [Clostridia bacterium]